MIPELPILFAAGSARFNILSGHKLIARGISPIVFPTSLPSAQPGAFHDRLLDEFPTLSRISVSVCRLLVFPRFLETSPPSLPVDSAAGCV